MSTTRHEIKSEIKRSLLEREERKSRYSGPQEGGGGEGLCLHSQEVQDLCACATEEQLIFNLSSEHQTMNLSNKCMTKDLLSDFHHGCTVHGGHVVKQRNENTREPRLPGLLKVFL